MGGWIKTNQGLYEQKYLQCANLAMLKTGSLGHLSDFKNIAIENFWIT
jgi:hypothetical protein